MYPFTWPSKGRAISSNLHTAEDLPEAMNDRERWRERVRDIRADGKTRWDDEVKLMTIFEGDLMAPFLISTYTKVLGKAMVMEPFNYLLKRPTSAFVTKQGSTYCWRCSWFNGYSRRKWTRRHEFKP